MDGEVPQLLEALRQAGENHFDVTLDRRNVSVNGVSVTDMFEAIRQNGQTLVPVRILAELVGAKTVWNEETRSVQVVSQDGAVTYTPQGENEFVLKDGTSYVNVESFRQAFSGLTWSDDGKKLVLSVKS
ncbi:copper amine oxidase N-terminal domain-containing protein [Paenibacillus sp. P26]|nr:copper amine oxidase N-terminal domain-containing protein [Paenibacillus sp. P26]